MKLTWRYAILFIAFSSLIIFVGHYIIKNELHTNRSTSHLRPNWERAEADEEHDVDDSKAKTFTHMTQTHDDVGLPDVEKRQRLRRNTLRRACSDLGFGELPKGAWNMTSQQLARLRFTYVIDKHRLLYCYVPKVSCTNWKRLFLVSQGVFKHVDDIKNAHIEMDAAFRKVSKIPVSVAREKLSKYAHFVFVRNPFSRLLSAFREKIENREPATCYFSKYITRWFRRTDPGYLARRNVSKPGYTFPEFVRYVAERRGDNEHWNDQYKLCTPCAVDYDFIGKYETLREDSDAVLRRFTNDSTLSLPAPQKRPTHSSDDEILAKYYREIPDKDFEALIRVLYPDMRLFGYLIPDSIQRRGLTLSAKFTHLFDAG